MSKKAGKRLEWNGDSLPAIDKRLVIHSSGEADYPRSEAYKYFNVPGEILMKLFRYTIVGACALLLMVSSKPAFAVQVFSGRVTGIELTYMPGSVRFFLDNGNAACPAGTALYWQNANVENNKIVYAALATALASRQQIAFYINDNDQSCVGRFIYLRPA